MTPYTKVLENIAEETGCFFINPSHGIWSKINSGRQSEYLVDWIHSNAAEGVQLYSEAVIKEL